MSVNDLPDSPRARRQLQRAESYLSAGDRPAAIGALEQVAAELPRYAPALLRLAQLTLNAGDHARAWQWTQQAVRAVLPTPAVRLQLLQQLVALGDTRTALDLCAQARPYTFGSPQLLALAAQQISRLGAHALAREYAQAAVDLDRHHPPSLYMLATLQVYFGEIDAAVALLEHCLRIHSGAVEAHWLLSRLRQPDGEARIARIERELARVAPGEDEAYLAYALHNELHEARRYPEAWRALERACKAKRSQLRYDAEATGRLFDALLRWDALPAASDEAAPAGPRPIFIVGLHRSGTTLVERILGGHSQIAAAGETYEFPHQLRRATGIHSAQPLELPMVEARARLDLPSLGRGYVAAMHWRARGRPWVTDKLPSNFLNLGFIAAALPQARIIHVRRDPIDIGLSTLRTLYTQACGYSYDPGEFVQYHGWYQQLMAHWQQVLPGRILDVHYEDVVADPMAAAERMAAWCGLPAEPAMVDIQHSRDPVATASSVLVRDGIRKDRSRLWQAYAEPLSGMIVALTPAT